MSLQERDACIYVPENKGVAIVEIRDGLAEVIVTTRFGMRKRIVPLADLRPYDYLTDGCFMCRKQEPDPEDAGLTVEELRARAERLVRETYGAVPPERRRMSMCRECGLKMYEMDRALPFCSCPAAWDGAVKCTCEYRRSKIPDVLRPK